MPYLFADVIMKSSKGNISQRFLKQNFDFEMSGFIVLKNNRFFKIFDNAVQQLMENGVNSHVRKKHEFHNLNPISYSTLLVREPTALNLNQLEAGFVLSAVLLFASFIVFLFEIRQKIIKHTGPFLIFTKLGIEKMIMENWKLIKAKVMKK